MMRILAVAIAAAFIAAPNPVGAQNKPNEAPIAANRFGISIDGVQKPKKKGLKTSSGKKGSSAKNSKVGKTGAKKSP
jgi:hypothetical protein